MNLAVLPIALLGRNDTREKIEYYGTFSNGKKQENMVWTVRGAAEIGLPSEFAERVLVALLYNSINVNRTGRETNAGFYSEQRYTPNDDNKWFIWPIAKRQVSFDNRADVMVSRLNVGSYSVYK